MGKVQAGSGSDGYNEVDLESLMTGLQPHYDRNEFARRGQEAFAKIAPRLAAADRSKFVAIDIDSADYEVDLDDYAATQRLLARRPQAQIWLMRFGERTAFRMGAHGHPGGEA